MNVEATMVGVSIYALTQPAHTPAPAGVALSYWSQMTNHVKVGRYSPMQRWPHQNISLQRQEHDTYLMVHMKYIFDVSAYCLFQT